MLPLITLPFIFDVTQHFPREEILPLKSKYMLSRVKHNGQIIDDRVNQVNLYALKERNGELFAHTRLADFFFLNVLCTFILVARSASKVNRGYERSFNYSSCNYRVLTRLIFFVDIKGRCQGCSREKFNRDQSNCLFTSDPITIL